MVRKAGFTLIELLVVVSIIALLIAILLPSLARARERSLSVACLANLKGLANSFQIYASDFDGIIARNSRLYNGAGDSNGAERYWYSFYNGDLGPSYFTFDPNKPGQHSLDRCPKSNRTYHNGAPTGYGMFVWQSSTESEIDEQDGAVTVTLLPAPGGTALSFNEFKIIRVQRPADTLLLADSSGGTGGPIPVDMSYSSVYVDRTSASTQSTDSSIWLAHLDEANVLYFDGHATADKVGDLKAVANYNKFTTRRTGVSVYKTNAGVVTTDLTPP